ncbi:MFS general substrate transporter [Westerdykella ornata]|uniref:MFS general substrate transporter n=1 Tax=Westerdykella ornata TaxID=318751 RepID=A0A6A6JGL1_WESOR|nr:MFS general substrate transporter [Westerdykella ornata]KAF2275562.1 MFS general substrate transporter [Westerdykella ornata]
MVAPKPNNGSHPSERTPLLASNSDPDDSRPRGEHHGHASVSPGRDYADDTAIGELGQGALDIPTFPVLAKRRSYSHSHWLAPDEDPSTIEERQEPTRFQENGILEGITKPRFRFVYGGILLGYFIAMFDSTLMASSHPVITSYFHASNSASWLSTAFLLTSTSFQPLFGRVSDTIGRRPLYLSGLLFLGATTAWCALAQSIGSFIAARAFCGLGAAGVLAMGNIMTNDLVGIEVRGTYQAYINLFYGGGSAAGAAFGGFLCDTIGWRMTFAIQIPVILLLFVNGLFTTPSTLGPNLAARAGKGIRHAMKGFDIAGSILLAGSVAFLILGLNLGGNVYPWKHPLVITSLVIAVIAFTILLYVESRAARPVMPLGMLHSAPRGNLVFHNFFAQLGFNTIIFNAPLYFQAVKLESPSVSGFRLAGPTVALTICGVSAGFIMAATGRMKWLIVVGSLSTLLGAICLSLMWDSIPTWLATIFLGPASIGQGLSFPATSLAVLATSSQEDQAVMTSTLTLWRSLGVVMGVSASSVVLQNALGVYLERFVEGSDKAEVILRVRKSVKAIHDLRPVQQGQVINAYARSLRLTFISAIFVFVIVNVLVFPIKLPNLKKRPAEEEQQGEDEGSRLLGSDDQG